MPKPFRGQISGSSPTGMLIRASKDAWCRGLYRRLGPEEFYRRRLVWLQAHGKTTSYNRLVAYLAKRGIDIYQRPNAQGANVQKPPSSGSSATP